MALSCDHPDLLPLDEALDRLWEALPAPRLEEVRAGRDDPAADRSAMDGLAVRAADGAAERQVLGTVFAGEDPAAFQVLPGTAVRIMTGAVLPSGADAVVPVEQLAGAGDRVRPTVLPAPGDHVRPRGDQARAGDLLLPAGAPHTSARAGLRAQEGLAVPPLARVPVAVASTGDELAREPLPHQIRDANGPMLAALALALGAEPRPCPPLPDDPAALAAALRHPAGRILVTSGGVSMGERDHLPAVLQDLGARILFHRIRLRPGKPMLAAVLGDLLVLGLPGNPVSAYLNARLFLPLALARLEGRARPEPWRPGVLEEAIPNRSERPLLHPCTRRGDRLQPLRSRGSADLAALARADACAWVEPGGLAAGGATRWLTVL